MGRNRETLVRSSCVILFMYPIAYITPSYREGKKLRQLREALTKIGVTVIPVELPYYSGPETCLHLLSLISIVDHQLVVIYPPRCSVSRSGRNLSGVVSDSLKYPMRNSPPSVPMFWH